MPNQGLIQKEKVDIGGENGAQISVVANKIVTQGGSEIMIVKQAINYTCFYFLVIMLIYVTDLIKKLELSLLVTFIFNKT